MIPVRFVMIASSVCLAAAGIALLFLPGETLRLLGLSSGSPLFAQLASALYLGNAAANWMAKGTMIGGIYARPLAVANYTHFFIGAMVLAMGLRNVEAGIGYYAVLFVYGVFGALFALLLWGKSRAGHHR